MKGNAVEAAAGDGKRFISVCFAPVRWSVNTFKERSVGLVTAHFLHLLGRS
jgi:hypothetical protein